MPLRAIPKNAQGDLAEASHKRAKRLELSTLSFRESDRSERSPWRARFVSNTYVDWRAGEARELRAHSVW